MYYIIIFLTIITVFLFYRFFTLKKENSNLKQEVHKYLIDIRNLTVKNESLLKENEIKSSTIKDHEEQIRSLSNVKSQLEARLHNGITKYRALEAENSRLKKELNYYTNITEESKELNASSEIDEDLEGVNLSPDQQKAFEIMENTNKNILLLGKAGCGKSLLLKYFCTHSKKTILKTAPTGIAALNIKGATLHSVFEFNNLSKLSLEDIDVSLINDNCRIALKEMDTLVIDEISMVRSDVFTKIDKLLQMLMKKNKSFGGKQIILVGDIFQLPPVVRDEEYENLIKVYKTIFFFNTDTYKKANFNFIELYTNHRAKNDARFFEILNRIRDGSYTDNDLNILNERVSKISEPELERTPSLYSTKGEANNQNDKILNKAPGELKVFKAEINILNQSQKNYDIDKSLQINEELHLKKGCLVMMVKNDINKCWVNGDFGIVEDFCNDIIKVAINGNIYDVYKETFSVDEPDVNEEGKIIYKPIFEVTQYPMVLGYAFTIHKSQGKTFSKVRCKITNTFATGQAYVALSRCKDLNGLILTSSIKKGDIRVSSDAKEFYSSMCKNNIIL